MRTNFAKNVVKIRVCDTIFIGFTMVVCLGQCRVLFEGFLAESTKVFVVYGLVGLVSTFVFSQRRLFVVCLCRKY